VFRSFEALLDTHLCVASRHGKWRVVARVTEEVVSPHYQRDRALLRRSAPPHPAHVCFVNVASVDRILYSIFQRFNLEWKTRTYLHKAA
jgi:hypothetical protein